TSVSINPDTVILNTGSVNNTKKLTVSILPLSATSKDVAWSSDNEAVATVDEYGLVTAVSVGTATVTATASNGVKGSSTITVRTATEADNNLAKDMELVKGGTYMIPLSEQGTLIERDEWLLAEVNKFIEYGSTVQSVHAGGDKTAEVILKNGDAVSDTFLINVSLEPGPVYQSTGTVDLIYDVEKGTSKEEVIENTLPDTVPITSTKAESAAAGITWSSSDYNADEPGEYTFTGGLVLPPYWSGNPEDLTVKVTVKTEGTTPTTYTVTYDANGGTGEVPKDETAYDEDETVTVLFTPVPLKTDNTFIGWATTQGAAAADYAKDSVVSFDMGAADVTLYAVWKESITTPTTYTVTYDANGGTGDVPKDETAYNEDETVTVLFTPAPSKTDNTFIGWATNQGATAATYTIGGVVSFNMGAADVTLYAVWKESIPAEITGILVSADANKTVLTSIGDTVQLTAQVMSTGEVDTTVTWSSSDNTVATIDSSGRVRAVADVYGSVVTFTATSTVDTNMKDDIQITVSIDKTNQDLISVTPPGDYTIPANTMSLEQIKSALGDTVVIVTTASTNRAQVTWAADTDIEYNGAVAGVYTLSGEVTLPAWVSNDVNNVGLTITVDIIVEGEETTEEAPASKAARKPVITVKPSSTNTPKITTMPSEAGK
ncbi:MAG: InlB B-repeat-containing protein, partial [Clostridiales bacterium]|nr:InlB B-repeat-containing protein [Clostridiales bacterium]